MSRIDGRANDDLLLQKGGRGFPHLAYLDADGDVLAVPGTRAVDGFREAATAAKANADLKAKGAAGDADAAKAFFLVQMKFNAVSREAATKALATLAFSPEEKAQVEDFLLGQEIQALLKTVKREDPSTLAAAGKACADMLAAGRAPKDPQIGLQFFALVVEHAKGTKDWPLADKAIGELKSRLGGEARFAKFLEKIEKDVAALKGASADQPK